MILSMVESPAVSFITGPQARAEQRLGGHVRSLEARGRGVLLHPKGAPQASLSFGARVQEVCGEARRCWVHFIRKPSGCSGPSLGLRLQTAQKPASPYTQS